MNTSIYKELRQGRMPKIQQNCMSGGCNNVIERTRFCVNGRCVRCKKKQAREWHYKKAFTNKTKGI